MSTTPVESSDQSEATPLFQENHPMPPAAPASRAGSSSHSGTRETAVVASPRGRRSPSLASFQASKVVRPLKPARASSRAEREINELKIKTKSLERELAVQKDLAQSRADHILYEETERIRMFNLAALQTKHLAQHVQSEHVALESAQENYVQAEAGARHYAHEAYAQHCLAEQHASQTIQVGQEAFKRISDASSQAYDFRSEAQALLQTQRDIAERENVRNALIISAQLNYQSEAEQAQNMKSEAAALLECLRLHEGQAANAYYA